MNTTTQPASESHTSEPKKAYVAPRIEDQGPLRAAIRGVGTDGHDVIGICDPSGDVDCGCP